MGWGRDGGGDVPLQVILCYCGSAQSSNFLCNFMCVLDRRRHIVMALVMKAQLVEERGTTVVHLTHQSLCKLISFLLNSLQKKETT